MDKDTGGPRIEQMALLAAYITATMLTHKCFHRPNPRVTGPKAHPDDIILHGLPDLPKLRELAYDALGILHILHTIFYNPLTNTIGSHYSDHLNPTWFTWNTHTIRLLAAIIIAATIRLAAFSALGTSPYLP